ncbi:phosphoribosyltransferase family protein [Sporosarcina thermotolerans]|uniref:Phosphoribosyltransferase family protein n=1 Tax=Sporosarcina thermotolerans TaxID=633404 RepID=A0AAW9AAE3_9BACL|nr:phosphoribosyltransferase family protein [Sporosarcina thermotolerans]MDW0116935.1 phosphoribosyltransferase family protein [Sporosarcina thermotolerans]
MNCLLCEQKLASTPSWQSLLAIEKTLLICEICSNSFERVDTSERGDVLHHVKSLYTYNEAMREYLHQYKFLQDVALSGVFANELRNELKRKNAIIVPIPMHLDKKIERTFSHVEELLHAANIPFEDLLVKTNTEVMGEKTREERLAMRHLFSIKEGTVIQQTTYILVDDIYTTGTTLQHAATALLEAGAERVEAVTLIRAER